jgi:Concanavalin A-like lectin/glucanases superfamily
MRGMLMAAARRRIPPPAGVTLYDPYYNNVVALLRFETPASCENEKGLPWLRQGNVTNTTSQFLGGVQSCYFDGVGDYIRETNGNTPYAFGAMDFTIEAWVRLDSVGTQRFIYDSRNSTGNDAGLGFYINSSNLLALLGNNVQVLIASHTPLVANEWYHVAVTRIQGKTFQLWLDGVLVGTSTDQTYSITANYEVRVGASCHGSGNESYFLGYIDEVRITSGVARYTANFIPLTEEFDNAQQYDPDPFYNQVIALLPLDGDLTDATGRTWTASGGAAATGTGRYGGNALELDGVNDYISTAGTTDIWLSRATLIRPCLTGFITSPVNALQGIKAVGKFITASTTHRQ